MPHDPQARQGPPFVCVKPAKFLGDLDPLDNGVSVAVSIHDKKPDPVILQGKSIQNDRIVGGEQQLPGYRIVDDPFAQ